MFIKKVGFVFISFLLLLTLTACYNLEIEQKIYADGSADISIRYDMSMFIDSVYEIGSGLSENETEIDEDFTYYADFCEGIVDQLPWQDAGCHPEDTTFTLSGYLPSGSIEIFDDGDTYTYRLKDVYDLLNSWATPLDDSDGFSDAALWE